LKHAVIIDTTMTTPPTGGSHKFLIDLCAPLAARGWAVSFVAQPGPERGIVEALRAAGADVRERVWRETHLPEERAGRLAAWVNSIRPDAYVISTSPDAGWLALPLLDASIPTVSIAHNDVGAYYAPLKHYGALVDCAVSVSEEIERKTVEECGVSPERARRVPYGVYTLPEAEALARAEGATVGGGPLKIGYVGRVVVEQKRVLEMAPLAHELERRGVEFELHVVGDGEARGPLEEELRRLGVRERVKFWGWLAPEEVRRRLSELDVFLLMSDYEGLSVALLEAMGQALAPVVTDIRSGTGEVVEDGRSGFLVPVGDIKTFADRIERLARERRLLASLKRAAWEASRPYTVERMADAYVECFEAARALSSRRVAGALRQPGFPVMPSCRSRYPFWLRKIKRGVLVSAGRGRY
jgi:glycosyltransferase involved in cell wall biosynthesis